MLKNNELILRMSLHQRVRLITSGKPDENCAVESYEFPIFHLYPNPALKTEAYATFFPSDKALAAIWNGEFVRNVYECTGNEAKANKPYAYFNVTDSAAREGISEDPFVTAEFLKQKVLGISASGAYINFDDKPETYDPIILNERVRSIQDGVIPQNKVNSVRVYNASDIEKFKKLYGFNGLFFGVATQKKDVAKYFSQGAAIVFANAETYEGIEDYLVQLTEQYKSAHEQLRSGAIQASEVERRIHEGEILDEQAINSACDKVIDLLLSLKDRGPNSVEEQITRISKSGHDALFNEVYHDKLAYSAAQQSVVLIKNSNNALPINREIPVAVIGEYATNNDYRITNNNSPTALRRPFDEINAYKKINAIGYAHGYCEGEIGRSDLIETALNLCDEAKCAIVYLCAGKGERTIPAGQTELLDALFRKEVKVIAVVSAPQAIDLSFADRCEAVLFSYDAGQGCAQAVFDIITGEISPSGKLVDTFYKDFSAVSVDNALPDYCTAPPSNVRYPFGYGLSFAQFECKNLKITEKGASFTIANSGNYSGYCTVLMYVKRVGGATTLANKLLRGYCKVFVNKGDSAKAEIIFNDNTFKVYDSANNRQLAQGGKYEISLCDNANTVLLSNEFNLKEKVFGETIVNKVVETSAGSDISFTDTELDAAIRREKKKLSFGLKIFITLLLTIYYDVMGVGLLLTNLVAEKTMLLYIVVGVLLLAGNIVAIVCISKLMKSKKMQNYLHPNEVLSDMVDNVKEFYEVAKVTYEKPVVKPVTDFNVIEDVEEEDEAEEEPVRRYDVTFSSDGSEEIELSQKASFNELCVSLRTFFANRGVTVEITSLRSLLSAMFSGKMTFISCKNKDVLPAFLSALCEYFSISGRAKADDEWKSQDDLLWKKAASSHDYVLSDISNALNSASKAPERSCFILIENVSMGNIGDYMSTFLDYANFPTEPHTLQIGEELSLEISKNIGILLVPSSDGFAEEFTPAVAHAGMVVDMVISAMPVPEEKAEEEIKAISREGLRELINEAREQFFVGEKFWKKLDEFVDTVNATEKFAIDNKSLMRMETYCSVLMECGGDENEGLINMFTTKIIPLLKVSKAYRKENGGKQLYGIIEKLFGEENLNAIQKALVQ